MRLENYSPEKLAHEILNIAGQHLDLGKYEIFFFGSRVADTGSDRSDIDVGIRGPAPVLPTTLSVLREEIENLPLLYKIEIVDFAQVSDDFRDVALQHIEHLNSYQSSEAS